MPVELQSEILLSEFWHEVKRHMLCLLNDGKIAEWKIVIRPKIRADEDSVERQCAGTPGCAAVDQSTGPKPDDLENEGGNLLMDIHLESKSCVFMFPSASDNWIDPYGSGELMTSKSMARELFDALELSAEE